MINLRLCAIFLIAVLFFALGCSGSGPVTQPVSELPKDVAHISSHFNWGLWQFVADPEAQTLDVVQLRQGNFHLNALPFLEPPPFLNLTLESLEFNGDIVEADIGLRHPFLGLTEFTGFDVCGILYTNGSITGFTDPDLRMAGEGETRLLNPDGFSRWWNPAEFPINNGTIFGYTDGLLGAPDSFADFSSTLNGYKYFTDDLDPGDPLSAVDPASRGLFSAGQKNIRTFEIQLGTDGLVFNYAVDASWMFPGGDPPWTAPDDFLPGANRAEPWRIEITEAENTLWNDGAGSGGNLGLQIDVYDWFNGDMNTVRVESPGNFTLVESATATGGGVGYSTYELDIIGATPAVGEIELLLSIVSEEEDYSGFVEGVNTTAYFKYTAEVGDDTPALLHWELDTGGLIEDNAGMHDLSPALAWETDNQLRCFFNADTTETASTWYSWQRSRRSDDGGQTWIDSWMCGTHGGSLLKDHTKLMPADNGNSFGLQALANSSSSPYDTDNPRYELGRSGDHLQDWNYGNMFVRYDDCGELICASNGLVHVFGDELNAVPQSGIYQEVGNQTWTLFYDWSGWTGDPPAPPNWWWYDVVPSLVVSGPAHLSDTRSVGDDSTGTIYLAYWGGVGSEFIRMMRSTDGPTALTWASVTVFEQSGYSDIRDPGLDIDTNNRIHISFLRHNDTTDEDEICYTWSDNSGDTWSTAQVVYSTSEYLTDTPVVAYEAFGASIVAICFEEDDSVYMVSSFNGGTNWSTPLLVSYAASVDNQPDMVYGTDDDLHFAFSHMGTSDREIHYRNAVLTES